VRRWEGDDSLRGMLLPLDDLNEAPGNPHRGDVEALARSLQRFGQMRPVLVTPDRTVTAGNHVVKAARSLGWTHIAAQEGRFETPEEARAYLLADNRLSELGSFDVHAQISMIEELAAQDSLTATGYTIDDAEDMRAQLSLIAEQEPEFTGAGTESPEEIAQRQKAYAKHEARREVVLLLAPAVHSAFLENVTKVMRSYGIQSRVDTIVEAVRREAARTD
jgi:hypothetical protein